MIRINRPEQAPDVLLGAGERETRQNRERYESSEEEYRSGSEKFTFERSIYAHATVKESLLQAQHGKCCYCESKFRATSFGAIEHFRPKRAVKQESGARMQYPGYYWLAYGWGNLLVSCEICNSRYKGSLFPLADEETRARSHRDDIEAESPLFVDPAGEDPGLHIRFRRAEVEHITERGLKTVEGMGLHRGELEDARAEVLAPLDTLCTAIEDLGGEVQSSRIDRARGLLSSMLQKATRPEAEFSAMMRDFMDSHALGVDES